MPIFWGKVPPVSLDLFLRFKFLIFDGLQIVFVSLTRDHMGGKHLNISSKGSQRILTPQNLYVYC